MNTASVARALSGICAMVWLALLAQNVFRFRPGWGKAFSGITVDLLLIAGIGVVILTYRFSERQPKAALVAAVILVLMTALCVFGAAI